MKKKFILLPFIALLGYVILSSYSSGPGFSSIEGTGVLSTGCSCHNATATSSTAVSVQLYDATGTTLLSNYVAGGSYKIRVTGTQTSGSFTLPRFGFQVSAMVGSSTSTNAGTLSAISGTHTVSVGGVNLVEHSSAILATTGSGGSGTTYVVNIPWTAPSSGTGNVTLRSVINAVNFDGGYGTGTEDKWNTGSASIPELGAITGTTTTCVGNSTTLSNSFSGGGTWSTTSPNISITSSSSSSATVSGVSVGTGVVTFTAGGNFVTKVITVTTGPGSIGGSLVICQTQSTTLTNSVGGGTWSSASSNVSVSGAGSSATVTGINAGTAAVTYAVGSCSVTAVVVINPLAAITGSLNVCEGATTALGNVNSGGTWTSSNTAVGTVSSSGVVAGILAGTTNISYALSTGCTAVATVTVNTQPPAIGGPNTVCPGSTITATNTAAGAWSSSSAGPGSVSIGATTGIINPVTVGTTTITYTASTGGCFSTELITVNPLPSPILGGFSPVCANSTITLTSTPTTGTWASGNPSVATISSTGVVTPASPAGGTSTMSYTLPTGCRKTLTITVTPISPVTGALNVCTGLTTSLSSGPSGGTWSSSTTAVGTVSTSGVVTGLTAGTTTITYTSGSCFSTAVVTVGALSPITGGGSVCVGSTLSLNDATTGGTWSSGSPSVGTIDATSGVFTALATGNSTVVYTTGSGCSTSTVITVNPTPGTITASGGGAFCNSTTITASGGAGGTIYFQGTTSGGTSTATPSASQVVTTSGTYYFRVQSTSGCWGSEASVTVTINSSPVITGTPTVCVTATTTLNSTTGGGTWSSPSANVSVVASSGNVTGILAGTANVTYTITSTGCFATQVVTVNPVPADYTLSQLCVGGGATLSTTPTGGTWTSSNTAVASIGLSSGLITTGTAGTANITYTLGTGCALAKVLTVNALPGSITGTAVICQNTTTTLNATPTGGTWASSTPSVATVNASTGEVIGAAPGTTTVTYTLGTGCFVTRVVSVNPIPSAFSGSMAVCTGATLSLPTTSFTYGSSDPGIFTVNSSGLLTGISAGTATLTYTSIANGCYNTKTVSVNASPSAITGASPVCIGSSIPLSSSPAGGTWSSPSSAVSVGASTGSVLGVSSGIATISYSLSNGCAVTATVTVNPLPSAIVGPSSICQGFNATFSSTPTTGTWSSSNTSVAIIGSSSGVTTGSGIGASTISYTLSTGCVQAAVVSVNAVPAAITGTTTTCVGSSTTLSTTSTGGSWSTASGSIATVGSASGIVTGVAAGTTTITYSFSTGCFTTTGVSITPAASAGTITGSASVCTGLTITLLDGVSGGAWSASNGNATVSSSGVVTGVTAGTTTITYTVTSGCGTVFTTKDISVTTSATAGTISGPSSICLGTTGTLTSSVTGGTWVSSNTTVAAIGSSSGIVAGSVVGTANITYTINSSCGIASTTMSVSVIPIPGPFVGGSLCQGSTTSLSIASGTWSSSNSAIATVDASGLMTGIAVGTATLTFTQTSTGCFRTGLVIVTAAPDPITGAASTCFGSPVTLSDPTTGGTWSSGNTTVALIGATSGTITALATGTTTITYTKSGCSRTIVFTVNATPASIGGLAGGVCVGNNATLTNTLPGGTWTSGNTAVGTIDVTTGVLTGISAGTSVITYMMPTGCRRTGIATINGLPSPISGTTFVCVGGTTTLTDAPTGGVWSSDNVSVATIGTSSGIVTGIGNGTTMITYAATTGCTRAIAVTVNPLPAPISGGNNVCVGSILSLTDATGSGNWISSATTIATVNATTGAVTGISAGTATISYQLLTGCNTTQVITVNALPSTFAGFTSVCAGSTITLGSTPAGGTWASGTPANATIDPATGVVTGIAAGTSAITYTASATGCMRSAAVTVNPLPSTISGILTVCSGNTAALGSTPGGGAWSSSSTSTATVGATTGIVSGIAAGTATIVYTLPTTCSVSTIVTVNSSPSITGIATVCEGSTTTLTGTITGGTWASGTTAVATIGSSSGVVSGVSAGTSVMTYTLSTGCQSAVMVTVNPLTSAGGITGGSTVCVGATTTLTESVTGGVWSVTNGRATVSTAGLVTGVAAGLDTVLYTVTGICGIVAASHVITINPLPVVGTMVGIAIACPGTTTTLSNTVSGGTWSSTNTSIATIGSSTGEVTGVAAGTSAITYTVTDGCGSAHASIIVTVLPAVDAGTISGVDTVCQGSSITLTTSTTGGTWLSSSPTLATVSTAGVVAGVAPGTVTIRYVVANDCSSDTASHVVTVRSTAECTSKVDPIRPAITGLKVYPNPNGGSFTVELPLINEDMTITILDMLGKTIETRMVNDHSIHTVSFNLTNIAAGSYMVKVNVGEQVYREKVVIW